MMCIRIVSTAVVLILSTAIGCTPDSKSGKGFRLPEGDIAQGKVTFERLRCQACHSISGVEFEPVDSSVDKMIPLGGTKAHIVTYGELVTSIDCVNSGAPRLAARTSSDLRTDTRTGVGIMHVEG